MIPSLPSQGWFRVWAGPKTSPASAGAATGDRANTRMLLVQLCGFCRGVALGATLYVSVIEPPSSGSPSTAYHGRSFGVVVTAVQLGSVRVRPWSSERAVP